MRAEYRRRWRIIRGYVIGWIAAFVFLSIVRGSGTIEEGSAQFSLPMAVALSIPFGVLLGCIAGYAQVLIEEHLYRRVPLRTLLVVRLLAAISFLVTVNLMAYATVTSLRGVSIGFMEFTFEPGSFAIYFYMLTVDTVLVALRQVNLLLGEGNLWKLLRGDFYTPREEERIFMFLDLQSSTTLAEELGHVTYSMLIQDCFDDLGVVSEHEARVYQYVGDGVVLTWALEDGLRDQNCLAAYARFQERLTSRRAHYLDRYRHEPRFTAGANLGAVTVTEVGRFKREIAYHGDTINTAARIQARCKELGQDLLIAESLANRLHTHEAGFVPLGRVSLRGKSEDVGIFAAPRR